MRTGLILTASMVGVALTASPSLAATYLVAPGGSDQGGDGSAQKPWQTLQYAADHVAAGDHVDVAAGNYKGFDLRISGMPGKPITFAAAPGVVINRDNATTTDGINVEGVSYVVIDGFKVTGVSRNGIRGAVCNHVTFRNNVTDANGVRGIFTGFCDDLLIENNSCSRSGKEHGIYVSNSPKRPVIRHNISFGNAGAGIHMNGDISQGGDGIISDALVEDNVIYDNGRLGGSGINCDGIQDSVIRNNLIYGNHASGISLYQGDAGAPSTNNVVVNNTIVMASDGRWCLNIQNGATGNSAWNNILYDLHSFHGSVSISPDSLVGFKSDYNAVMDRYTTDDANTILKLADWQKRTGWDAHSFVTTPALLFVDFAANDYHLSAASPAIDKGTSDHAPGIDLDGHSRPLGAGFDIGAYEFCPGGACLYADAGVPADLASPPGDADLPHDQQIHFADELGVAIPSSPAGCGCRLGERGSSKRWWLILPLAGLLAQRRFRRSRKC